MNKRTYYIVAHKPYYGRNSYRTNLNKYILLFTLTESWKSWNALFRYFPVLLQNCLVLNFPQKYEHPLQIPYRHQIHVLISLRSLKKSTFDECGEYRRCVFILSGKLHLRYLSYSTNDTSASQLFEAKL